MTKAEYNCRRCSKLVEWDSRMHRHDMFAEHTCGYCTDVVTYRKRTIRRYGVAILVMPFTVLAIAASWFGDNLYEGVMWFVDKVGGPAPHKARGPDPLTGEMRDD